MRELVDEWGGHDHSNLYLYAPHGAIGPGRWVCLCVRRKGWAVASPPNEGIDSRLSKRAELHFWQECTMNEL